MSLSSKQRYEQSKAIVGKHGGHSSSFGGHGHSGHKYNDCNCNCNNYGCCQDDYEYNCCRRRRCDFNECRWPRCREPCCYMPMPMTMPVCCYPPINPCQPCIVPFIREPCVFTLPPPSICYYS